MIVIFKKKTKKNYKKTCNLLTITFNYSIINLLIIFNIKLF